MLFPTVLPSLRPDGNVDYNVIFASSAVADDHFVQIGIPLFAAPQAVLPPAGLEFLFELNEAADDFFLNDAPYMDPNGIGYLIFFTENADFAIEPGTSQFFHYTGVAGAGITIPSIMYGLTSQGDLESLAVSEPASAFLLLTSSGLMIYFRRSRQLPPSRRPVTSKDPLA